MGDKREMTFGEALEILRTGSTQAEIQAKKAAYGRVGEVLDFLIKKQKELDAGAADLELIGGQIAEKRAEYDKVWQDVLALRSEVAQLTQIRAKEQQTLKQIKAERAEIIEELKEGLRVSQTV